jgi:hypothetical protein
MRSSMRSPNSVVAPATPNASVARSTRHAPAPRVDTGS